MCCSVLSCIVLQCVAVYCSVSTVATGNAMSLEQRVSQVCCSVLQCIAVYCSVLPMVASDAMCLAHLVYKVCSVLQCVLQCFAYGVRRRHIPRTARVSGVLQSVAVCCSVLQRGAMRW